MDKLKPCPFCGGRVGIKSITIMDGVINLELGCYRCGTEFRIQGITHDQDSIEKAVLGVWNRRSGEMTTKDLERAQELHEEIQCIEKCLRGLEVVKKREFKGFLHFFDRKSWKKKEVVFRRRTGSDFSYPFDIPFDEETADALISYLKFRLQRKQQEFDSIAATEQ